MNTIKLFLIITISFNSINLVGQSSSTLYPANDASVLNSTVPGNAYQANTNYGTRTSILADAGTSGGYNYTWRCYIGLDLSPLPANATLTSAQLYLYSDGKHRNTTTLGSGYQSNACWLQRTTQPWSQTSITWNTAPTVTSTNQVTLATSSSVSQNYVSDITSLVRDMIANPGQGSGMLMRLKSEVNYCTMSFYSSEYSVQTKRPKLVLTYTLAGGVTRTLTLSNNYIYSITPQVPKSDLSQAAASDLGEEVVYFDGLGRPMQKNLIGGSPSGKDVIVPIGYDDFGRENKKYLPYAMTTANNGAVVTNDKDRSRWTGSYGSAEDQYAFSQTEFEPSPLNRVLRQGSPGSVWQPGTDPATDHSVKMGYGTNTATEVILWKVSGDNVVNGGYYSSSTLYKTTTWDENNQANGTTSRSEEFKDKQGKVVLKRSYNGSEVFSTYYVYDDFDLLRVVIPPLANGDGGSIAPGVLNELCCQYKYDERKRMTGKKLPGADWVYMVYDKRDRLAATRDGVQQVAGQWLITKYDQLNRPVITALKTLGDDPNTLQAYFNSYPNEASYYESRNASSVGYTLDGSFSPKLSLTESDILTITYYDTYGFAGAKSFDTGVRISDYYNPATGFYYFDRLKGQVTGSRVKVLDGTENQPSGYRWLTSTTYYDDRYRVIQTLGDLYSPTWSDNEVTSTLYDFTGKVIKTQTRQVFSGQTNTVLQTNTYDQAGRLTQVKHKVNTGTEVTLASMEYNEVGQLKQKSLHGAVGSGIQNLNYAYNIRGWLERINNPDVAPSSSSLQKLNLGFYYNSVPSGFSCPAQYNGNISAMVWNTPGQAGALSPADKQGYGFTYDGLNRLLSSSYGEGATFASYGGANNENVTYDKNGNIKSLVRYKKETGLIDQLTYTYKNNDNSNMLDRVDDAVAGLNGFSEYVKMGNEYVFDANGNLTTDANKGYNSILYNYMNLPRRVGTTGQYITYIYSADGTKLAKVGTNNVVTTYAGSFVYTGSSLTYIQHPEGMYLPDGNYQYYLKDHLGNTRLVVNTSGTGGTIVQQTDYYPFGMDIASYNGGVENRYRYNGKELQTDDINGKKLDWYDYGARFYDPSLGRWHSVDPMAEMYNSYSPYAYVKNNPISSIDPNGMYSVFFNGQEVSGSDKKYLQGYYGMPDDSEESQEQEKNPKKSVEDAFSVTKKIKDFFGWGLDYKDPKNLDKIEQGLENTKNATEAINEVNKFVIINGVLFFTGEGAIYCISRNGGSILVRIVGKSIGESGITVLGKYNKATGGYVALAEKMGANYFQVPNWAWNLLGKTEQWNANVRFLDASIARGDSFILSNSAFTAKQGTSYYKEIQYLLSKGYKIATDGMSLIKP